MQGMHSLVICLSFDIDLLVTPPLSSYSMHLHVYHYVICLLDVFITVHAAMSNKYL